MHAAGLVDVLQSVRKSNMSLNPAKCSFRVQAGKFLDFMLTNMGIKENSYKFHDVISMTIPTNTKEVHQLMSRLEDLSNIRAGDKAFLFFTPKKEGKV